MTIKQKGGIFGRNPTFNEASIAALLVGGFSGLSSGSVAGFNGHVEIGTGKQLRFGDGDSKITGYSSSLFYFDSNNTRFRSGDGSTEFARFTSDGLLFNGDTAAANALDDYEEGTWTPEVADDQTGGNIASGTFTGYYTKIGRMVNLVCILDNIDTTGMTGGNALYVRNLPFAPADLVGAQRFLSNVMFSNVAFNTSAIVTAEIPDAFTYARIAECTSAGGRSLLAVSALTSGSADINLQFNYYT